MNSGINPNWLEDAGKSKREREAADEQQAKKLREYKVPRGKDYVTDMENGKLHDNFEPLIAFLELNKKDEKEQILSFMMYMGCFEGKFHYKNDTTRQYIVIDRMGKVVSEQPNALYWYTF